MNPGLSVNDTFVMNAGSTSRCPKHHWQYRKRAGRSGGRTGSGKDEVVYDVEFDEQ
jgi:hypothetical protein